MTGNRNGFSFVVVLLLTLVTQCVRCQHTACENRAPEGHSPHKRPGDGSFRLTVVAAHGQANNNASSDRDFYTPNQVYKVRIQGVKTRFSTQKLTEFLLVAESEKQAMMGPTGLVTTGIFHIMDEGQTRFSDICPDAVTSLNRQPKNQVEVLWTAPSRLVASCITFKVTVVERPHLWYMDDGKLTKTICPELSGSPKTAPASSVTPTTPSTTQRPLVISGRTFTSQPQSTARLTLPPQEPLTTEECCACDEAKYDVVFEGIWSKETHPEDFPENEWLLHFSDIIGASHSPTFRFWREGEVASPGMKAVAEWGSTRTLEKELRAKSDEMNTIIKARGLWHPNEKGTTSAAFRVDRRHPHISLVSMLGPSPDWIVGISGLQLCTFNCTWIEERSLDLFPYDAGTDSGLTYTSPNNWTDPQEPIRLLTKDPQSMFYSMPNLAPFAKLHLTRQRIYPKSCDAPFVPQQIFLSENSDDDINNRPECGVTEWTSWSACSVRCGKGLRMRKRAYLLPQKADMFRCDRQLVEKEMCLGVEPTCPPEEGDALGQEKRHIELDDDDEEYSNDMCKVTAWTEWSGCCEGTRTRTRRFKHHMGRKKCAQGILLSESETCDHPGECGEESRGSGDEGGENECEVVWSEWSPCSVPCGKGYRERSALALTGSENCSENVMNKEEIQRVDCVGEYGSECRLSLEEARDVCTALSPDAGPCRDHNLRYYFNSDNNTCLPFVYGGCKGNRNRFESDKECMETCGFLSPTTTTAFVSSTTTTSNTVPSPTTLSLLESEENNLDLGAQFQKNTAAEPTTVISTTAPFLSPEQGAKAVSVDCVMSPWTEWSPCRGPCGGVGVRTRARKIIAEPSDTGRKCPRKRSKMKTCAMDPCPSSTTS